MAFEPGGYADKLGNRYEGRWVARQLLFLLNEQIRSVTVESVGDDEIGVDLWIERRDGLREAQQCKAENGTKARWSLADLKRLGVLDHLRAQLQRDLRHRFTLVSASPATQFGDLSRSSRDSAGDAESFYRDQIQAGSKERQKTFSQWCKEHRLQESKAEDRAVAFDLLTRSGFHLFLDDHESREELRFMAGQAVSGDSDAVISLLANFAADNLRKTISITQITQHLRKSGFEPRKLFADERMRPRLDELQEEFDDSIRPHFAGGREIARPEVDELLKILNGASSPDAIVLHGSAGYGKSGILYQLTQKFREQGTPFLALRLDRKAPVGNAKQFGRTLGLPESPVNCLDAVSGGNHAILILDQLDAMRWTSSHSVEGLEVCKGLVRESRSIRLLGRRISVVLCCRTFDLEHDPQICAWLRPSTSFVVEKVAVNELPEARVRDFVGSLGISFDRMTARRRTLLRSVHNLAIWAEVVQSEDRSPEFDSGTDLMRRFWQNRRRQIEKAGIPATELDSLLNELVDYMELHATLSAPVRLIETWEKLAAELQTLNVLHASERTISFCHQSYLDFLIASRVAAQVASGPNAVIEWLGEARQQSLFRREQLRQLLFMLAEDDAESLSRSVERLLSSNDVRFHVKQLTIEAVGQFKPTNVLVDFVVGLTEFDDWRPHVLHDVLHRSVDWIRAFDNRGRLLEWLLSSDEELKNAAAWLLNSVAESYPPLLSNALAATLAENRQDLLRGILLYSKPQSEPADVFEFRIQCLKSDMDPPYIAWKEVAEERPDRAIQLMIAFLENRPVDRRANRTYRILEMDGSGDLKAMMRAARRCSKLAVRLLKPLLISVASAKIAEHRRWKRCVDTDSPASYPTTRIPGILLKLMIVAVRAMARKSPQRFEELCTQLSGISSKSIQALLIRGWTAMPLASADAAMNWLLSDLRRLRCGSELKKAKWCAAAILIERMSPHCSDGVFGRLEQTLVKYRDPEEKRRAKYWLELTREGHFENEFFAAQRFLLPSLDLKRRSAMTNGWIGCLKEKFGADVGLRFVRPKYRGGLVGSPLIGERIHGISDKQWLRLIANREVPRRDGHWRKGIRSDGGLIESSVEMFSRDFGIAAKRNPERFGQLVLKFPLDAPPDYLSEVLQALQQRKPNNEASSKDGVPWEAASRECVESVLERASFLDDADTMRSFCWLVRDRDDIRPSERVIARLISLTRHPHPEADRLVVGCDKLASEVGIQDLQQNAINCVRSLAVIAISSLLWNHRQLFDRFKPVLEQVLEDEHPVVRASLVQACLPVWNIDRSLAVRWFRCACERDLRLACGYYSQHLCNHAFPKFFDQLAPLVEAMCKSSAKEVAERGAQEATARWLFFGLFNDLVLECRNGAEPLRKGVASIVAQFVRDKEYASRCWPILLELCDDPSLEVREKAGEGLHDERILGTATSPESLQRFVTTRAFEDDPDSLIDALHDHPGSLVSFADLVCDTATKAIEIVRAPAPKSARRIPMIERHLSTVLLRLYEQAGAKEHANIRDRCLEMFDELLKHRITSAKSLLDKVER